jgi:hypothetical protein
VSTARRFCVSECRTAPFPRRGPPGGHRATFLRLRVPDRATARRSLLCSNLFPTFCYPTS